MKAQPMNDSAWQIGISLKWDGLTAAQRRDLLHTDPTMRHPKYRALVAHMAGSRFEFLTALQKDGVRHLLSTASNSLEAAASRVAVNHNSKHTMKNTTETAKDTTPKTPTPKAPKAKAAKVAKSGDLLATMQQAVADADAKNAKTAKVEKVAKAPKAEAEADAEPADRLPTTVAELKESKGGLVSFLFHSGKAKEEIAAELKAAFKLTDEQAAKIVRRITGRARFFTRVTELMAAK